MQTGVDVKSGLLLKKIQTIDIAAVVWILLGLQALLFSIPQAIAALFLEPIQSVLYITVYSWLTIGVIGGWSVLRTNSFWPGLASATLMNLILSMLLLLNNLHKFRMKIDGFYHIG